MNHLPKGIIMSTKFTDDMKYDFSHLSKQRFRTYQRVLEAFEEQNVQDIDDDDLAMLAAAGIPNTAPNTFMPDWNKA